jgi:hypothetical protein
MLFSPEAHEPLTGEPWSAERARTAITSIVADAESAFDDGWPMHPQDFFREGDDASHGGVSLSYDGTMSRIWSIRWKPRPIFPTRTPNAACWWARPESGWCYRGSHLPRRISSGCRI